MTKISCMRTFVSVLVLMDLSMSTDFNVTVIPEPGSNYVVTSPVGQIVQLFAGVSYLALVLTASTPFFGLQSQLATIKVFNGLATACSSESMSIMSSPLDGMSHPTQFNQLLAKWGPVKFDFGGEFTLCYGYADRSSLLALTVSVRGIPGTANKIFCLYDPVTGCQAVLSGSGVSLPSESALALVPHPGVCGVSALTSVLSQTTAAAQASGSSKLLFGFGTLLPGVPLGSFTACFCPGYEAVWTGVGPCTASAANFVQTAGTVIFLSFGISDPLTGSAAAVFTRLRFDLSVRCGSGGCSEGGSQRIKVVDAAQANIAPYFSDMGGCRSALQSGSYLSPSNCASGSATACSLVPTVSADTNIITFKNLQMDSSGEHDVCFCDANCAVQSSWFRIGSFTVKPLAARLTIADQQVTRPSVDLRVSVEINAASAASLRLSGTLSRELKLLADNQASVTPAQCLRWDQSTALVRGHDCYSVTNCAQPAVSTSTLLRYGGDEIVIRKSGFVALCFCNADCSEELSWQVVDRVLISGPEPEQRWEATERLLFDLQVTGWGLGQLNSVFVIASTGTCASAIASAEGVVGPAVVPAMLQGTTLVSVRDAGESKVGLSGTLVEFGDRHGLMVGDWVEIVGIETGDDVDNGKLNKIHRVSAVVDAFTVQLALFLTPFPLSVSVFKARWVRTNTQVFPGLTVLRAGQYTVCWRQDESLAATAAGTLVVTAPRFTTGAAGLASVVADTPAPMALQFTTSGLAGYVTGTGVTAIEIVFTAPALLLPVRVDGKPIEFRTDELNPTLDKCGAVVAEANSLKGFPQPSGCSWRKERNRAVIRMEFTEGNGLAPADTVTLVMHASAAAGLSPVNPSDPPIEVWVFAAERAVVEVALLRVNRAVVAGTGQAARVDFTIVSDQGDVAGSAIELTGFCSDSCLACSADPDCGGQNALCVSPAVGKCVHAASFSFEFTVTDGQILPGSQVRLLLFPLNDWSLQLSPVLTCQSATVGKTCGPSSFLATTTENLVSGSVMNEAIVGGGLGGNVLKFLLPLQASAIGVGTGMRFSVASLRLPLSGFFPTFFWVEIIPPDLLLSDPVFVRSSVAFAKRPALLNAALVKPQDLEVPLSGAKNFVLYMKLVTGFLLNLRAELRISMPAGFICRMERVLNCNLADPVACMHSGITPGNLSLFRNRVPSGRGLVGARTLFAEDREAAWLSAGNECVLTLRSDTRIYSGSELYFALNVNPPADPMHADALANKWTVTFTVGDVQSVPAALSAASMGLVSTVAVLGSLGEVTIAPTSFAAGTVNELFVIFVAETHCGTDSAVVRVDAPAGFEVGSVCIASSLPVEYLVDETDTPVVGLGVMSCSGGVSDATQKSLNRATVTVREPLVGGRRYGFKLRVTNPSLPPRSEEWRVVTLGAASESVATGGCDRSVTVRSNPSDPRGSAWQVKLRPLAAFSVSIADMRPTGERVEVTVFPIRVSATTSGRIVITAPVGYRWSFSSADLKFKAASDGGVTGTDAALPITVLPVAPLSAPFNRLVLEHFSAPLVAGKTYGFGAKLIVPRRTPTAGLNMFSIEIGSAEGGLASAPPVRSLIGAELVVQTPIAGSVNVVCIALTTVSTVGRGDSVVVSVPSGFTIKRNCAITAMFGAYAAFPPGGTVCVFQRDELRLIIGASGMAAGPYRFCVEAENPATAGEAAEWTFFTRAANRTMLDFPVSVPGFAVTAAMQGGYVSAERRVGGCSESVTTTCDVYAVSYAKSNRDDRPGKKNSVLLWFRPEHAHSTPGRGVEITVRAPPGFAFAWNCAADYLWPLGDGVELPVLFTAWPLTATVTVDCSERFISVAVTEALLVGRSYLLRVSGLVNPSATPVWNFWTVTYGSAESTAPSAGFKVWAFENTGLVASNVATGETGTSVQLRFDTVNSIPLAGQLRITAPSGFSFTSPCLVTAVCVDGALSCVPGAVVNVACATFATSPERLTLTVNGGVGFAASAAYLVTLKVNNPDVDVDARPWSITGAIASGDILDSSLVPGYAIVSRLKRFELAAVSVRGGQAATSVQLTFSVAAAVGDLVRLNFPVGFVLNRRGSSQCAGAVFSPQSAVKVECTGSTLWWLVMQTAEIGQVTSLTVSTVNPALTPDENVFSLKVFRKSQLVSMGTVQGFRIVPRLEQLVVAYTDPVIAAAGSTSSVKLRFKTQTACDRVVVSGRVGTFAFMSSAGTASVTLTKGVTAGSVFETTLVGLKNPPTPGQSLWSVSTWQGTELMDELNDAVGPIVVGTIDIQGGSSVYPRIYGSQNSSLLIEFVSSVSLGKGAEIRLTPPPGYLLYSDSFAALVGVHAQPLAPPSNGVLKLMLLGEINAQSMCRFSLRVDLPGGIQESTSWRLDAVSNMTLLATNDASFAGFWLIAKLPFRVTTSSTTPSSVAKVRLSFTVPADVRADQSVHLQVTAPSGFTFSSATSCLGSSSSSWVSCIGTGNVATLLRGGAVMAAGAGWVDVVTTNPASTPAVNTWQLAVFFNNDASSYANLDSAPGYEIKAMAAAFVGSNRLGVTAPGFFSFKISADVISYFQVVVWPAKRYTVLCSPQFRVGMRSAPPCSGNLERVPDAPIVLTIAKSELNPSRVFTIGVTVVNPPSRGSDDVFALTILDSLGGTVEANAKIQGPALEQVFVGPPTLKCENPQPGKVGTATISVSVTGEFTATEKIKTTWLSFKIQAPENFMFSAPETVVVSSELPLVSEKPVVTTGNRLLVKLDPAKALVAGEYAFDFEVMNPSATPSNNVWVFSLDKGETRLFMAPLEGYHFD